MLAEYDLFGRSSNPGIEVLINMAKKYTGSLSLEWFNKQKSILLQKDDSSAQGDVPAPAINWVNKDEALFYEIVNNEGRGLLQYWVDRNDLRGKEPRPSMPTNLCLHCSRS